MIVCRPVGRRAQWRHPTQTTLTRITFFRVLDGVRYRNDVLAFSRIGFCNAGTGKAKDAEGFFKKIPMRLPHVRARTVRTRFLSQHFESDEQFGRA